MKRPGTPRMDGTQKLVGSPLQLFHIFLFSFNASCLSDVCFLPQNKIEKVLGVIGSLSYVETNITQYVNNPRCEKVFDNNGGGVYVDFGKSVIKNKSEFSCGLQQSVVLGPG